MTGKKRLAAGALALCLGALSAQAALAASPEFARTDAEWAALEDDAIEYEELADLIHEYNATVQNNAYEYRKFREDYGDTNADVADAYYDLAQDFYNDMTGDDDAGSMMSDLNLQIQADNMMEQADASLEDSRIYLLTYEQAEKSLVAGAQSDMISYHKLLWQRRLKEQQIETARTDYETAQVKLGAGLVTQVETLTAKEAYETAQNELAQLDLDIQEAKEGLIVLLGWKHSDSPKIGELPELDLSRADAMDPQEDLAAAKENNYTLKINRRKLENAKDQTTKEKLAAVIANNEKQIGASLSSAYQSVLSARAGYEEALAAARLERENTRLSEAKLAAGMITQTEHEAQRQALESSEASVRTASMDLFQAMETYDWNVKGLAEAG